MDMSEAHVWARNRERYRDNRSKDGAVLTIFVERVLFWVRMIRKVWWSNNYKGRLERGYPRFFLFFIFISSGILIREENE